MTRGYWRNAVTYHFYSLGGSRVTNMRPHNCPPHERRAYEKLTSYVNVTGILPIEEEEVCTVIEDELLPTESSNKSIPFALDPKFQQPCRYGLGCTRVGCLFQHPSDVPISKTELVDQDVYLSFIDPKATHADIMAMARPYGKVLGIAIKKDVAGKPISKRSDGLYSCNVHFLGVQPAIDFIKFINEETKIPVIKEMNARLNGVAKPIDLPAMSTPSTGVDWRDSLKNKAARMNNKPPELQQTRVAPVRSSAVKIINPLTLTEIDMPSSQQQPVQQQLEQQQPVQQQPEQQQPKQQQPKQQQPKQKQLMKDADGFTPVGRNSRPIYAALEIEGEDEDEEEPDEELKEDEEDEEDEDELEEDEELCLEANEPDDDDDDELCLEDNLEEKVKEQERTTCGTSSSSGTSSGASPFTVSTGPKLMSWHEMMQMQEDASKKALGVRSFASLFKAVDASDIDAQAPLVAPLAQDASDALVASIAQDAPVASLMMPEEFDGVDDDDSASIASAEFFDDDIDDLEDDHVFAAKAKKLAIKR